MPAKKRGAKPLTEKEKLKMEIARELGILEQVEKEGWDSLSNAVCGKVGGIMSKRLRDQGLS
jgi:small acid-soluble spore protein F (minor alpha/beta-type SASP)